MVNKPLKAKEIVIMRVDDSGTKKSAPENPADKKGESSASRAGFGDISVYVDSAGRQRVEQRRESPDGEITTEHYEGDAQDVAEKPSTSTSSSSAPDTPSTSSSSGNPPEEHLNEFLKGREDGPASGLSRSALASAADLTRRLQALFEDRLPTRSGQKDKVAGKAPDRIYKEVFITLARALDSSEGKRGTKLPAKDKNRDNTDDDATPRSKEYIPLQQIYDLHNEKELTKQELERVRQKNYRDEETIDDLTQDVSRLRDLNHMTMAQIQKLKKQNKDQSAAEGEVRAQLKTLEGEMAVLSRKRNAEGATHGNKVKELNGKLAAETERVKSLDLDKEKLRKRVDELTTQRDKLVSTTERIKSLESEKEKLQQRVYATRNDKLNSMTERVKSLEWEREIMLRKIQNLTNEIEAHKRLVQLQSGFRSEKDAAVAAKRRLAEVITTLSGQLEQKTRECDQLKTELEAKTRDFDQLEGEALEAQGHLELVRQTREDQRRELKKLKERSRLASNKRAKLERSENAQVLVQQQQACLQEQVDRQEAAIKASKDELVKQREESSEKLAEAEAKIEDMKRQAENDKIGQNKEAADQRRALEQAIRDKDYNWEKWHDLEARLMQAIREKDHHREQWREMHAKVGEEVKRSDHLGARCRALQVECKKQEGVIKESQKSSQRSIAVLEYQCLDLARKVRHRNEIDHLEKLEREQSYRHQQEDDMAIVTGDPSPAPSATATACVEKASHAPSADSEDFYLRPLPGGRRHSRVVSNPVNGLDSLKDKERIADLEKQLDEHRRAMRGAGEGLVAMSAQGRASG